VMEAIGLGGEENAGRRLGVLRAIDKFDKFGVEGVRLLLGEGRKDESGDFTKGAGLSSDKIEILAAFFVQPPQGKAFVARQGLTPGNPYISVENAPEYDEDRHTEFGRNDHALGVIHTIGVKSQGRSDIAGLMLDGYLELKHIAHLVKAAGYDDRIKIDPSVVRGLEYYTGPVYEAELTFDVTNEKGEKVVFGSVGGGGRYDGLVSRFMGQPVPATGFSIGVSRLMTALKNLGKLGQDDVLGPVLVTVMDGDVESMGRYQRFTQQLRAEGIRAEMYQGNWKKFGNQLKYADRRGAPIAIIQGGDERAQGVVQIKDLIEGKRLSGEITDNTEWREARVAQEVVAEADLVAKVKEILAAQAEDRRRAKGG
jgi:histidyl-tRNA synthetase